MGFSLFANSSAPIVINFGSSSVKLLQATRGDRPSILAAAEMPIPDSCRLDPDRLFPFFAEHLGRTIADGGFKGKKVIASVPASQTLTQHLQLAKVDGVPLNELVAGQLQAQTGCLPTGVVVRSVDVGPVNRNGQSLSEVICFAITRETVLRYIDLLRRLKLNPIGVHTETVALARAFEHLSRRDEDLNTTTMFIDLGWSGTHVAITHGPAISFARTIQVGGQHFDQTIAAALDIDPLTARQYRIDRAGALPAAAETEAAGGSNVEDDLERLTRGEDDGAGRQKASTAVATERRSAGQPVEIARSVSGVPEFPRGVDFTEQLETITDELSMCVRYYRGLFPDRQIDRAILVGGEARQAWLCQHIVRKLGVPGQLGDPLARMKRQNAVATGVNLDEPQPGWAMACGLVSAPTDL